MSDNKWYYVLNNQKYGPFDDTTMQQYVQNRTVNAYTLVWQQGMSGWAALQDTSLRAIVPVSPAPLAMPPAMPVPPPVAKIYDPQTFTQLFMWYWISLAAAIPLSFIIIGIFSAIASVVLFYILLYRYWDLIQDGHPQTTPGKAVGFCFIPFYSYYWIFVAIRGLAQDMNRYCRERSIPAPLIDEQMAQWYCILTICSVIPYLNFLTGIGAIVLQIILANSFTKTAVAIANAKRMQMQ